MADVAGMMLLGGRSRRMGTDKALLKLPGDALLTFVGCMATTLSQSCRELVLVARDDVQAALYADYLLPGARIVCDVVPDIGPLMGIYSGLHTIQASHALVTAVDMPFLQPGMVSFLLSQAVDDSLLVPLVDAIPQVLLAVYPRTLLPFIEERLHAGRRDPRSLLEVAPVRYIEEARLRAVDPELRSFVNVNTPEELARLRSF